MKKSSAPRKLPIQDIQMKKIPIFFTFNDDYAVPAAVAFYSLLHRAKPDVSYEMYVLHGDITSDHQGMLEGVVKRFAGHALHFIDTSGFLQDEWANSSFYKGYSSRVQFTADTLARCFGARFFPQYDKIIYSDVDVVFADDISDLWEVDLTDKYIAGVKGATRAEGSNRLDHLKPEHRAMLRDTYLAGGIWVMNLALIRRDNLEQTMMDIVRDDTIYKRWLDQDIINIACRNKVAFLPLNYIAYPTMLDYLVDGVAFTNYTQEELWDSILSPKIIHYAQVKPWRSPVRYADVWWDIFYYLGLPRTSIFRADHNPLAAIRRKVARYRNLTRALLAVALILAGVCLLLALV